MTISADPKKEKDSLEELLGRTEIKFPREVSLIEAEKLLAYVAKGLSCEVTYSLDERKRVGSRTAQFNKDKDGKYSAERIGFDIKGTFYTFSSSVTFDGEKYRGVDMLGAIRFFTTPGYSLEKIPRAELNLMDSVRSQIEKYFSKNRKA